jgi:glycosyltransferase involved in cell wall biosynthesis
MDGVSVIIPMKNAELTIEKCILSIVNQSYSFLEIIVCDDGSADGSIAVVEHLMQKYDNITLLKNKVSKGAANARNRCIAEAKYNYIAVQDADDWSARDRIEKEMSFLATHPEYAVVGSGCYRVNEFGEKKIDIPMEYISKKDLIWGGHFVHASCIFRKEVLCEVGGYTDNKYTKRDQDYHLLLKLYGKGYRLYNLQECLYYYLSTDATYIRQIDLKKVRGLMWIRYDGYRRNNMPIWAYFFVFKPLIAVLIPKCIMLGYYKRKVKTIKNDNRE